MPKTNEEGIDIENVEEKFSVSKEEWENTIKQIDNLNKGIATYRKEANDFKERYEDLSTKYEDLVNVGGDAEEDLSEGLHPNDQKKIEDWAKRKGFVTSSELEAEKNRLRQESQKMMENQVVSEFLEKHPEYEEEENWTKIKEEFSLYRTPTNIEGYKKILSKIHKDLSGEKDIENIRSSVKAEEKIKGRLSLGGGSQKSDSSKENDLETLRQRYPNLSEEHIKSKLAEIDALYEK